MFDLYRCFFGSIQTKWLMLGGILWLGMVRCQGQIEGTLTLAPGPCNPLYQLKNNPAYATIDLKQGLLSHPYQDLFSRGREKGCLVARWVGQQQTEDNTPYAKAVDLLPTGQLQYADPQLLGSPLQIDFPDNRGLQQPHLQLYVIPSTTLLTQPQHNDLCRSMQRSTYQCFDASNQSYCRFYINLYPVDTKREFAFAAQDVSCRLCVPEICNGKDDDCDGTIDNVYGSKNFLERTCYTGPTDSLRDGKTGLGECRVGTQRCTLGQWDTCVGQITPQSEKCNGKDDNCDGKADEGDICPSGQICLGGTCQLSPCRPGEIPCGPNCINVNEDIKHCGACNKACASGERCAQGQCVTSCPQATPTVCGNSCINTQNHREHCGACGQTCAEGQICFAGQCVLSCPTSAPLCGSAGQKTCCPGSCCDNTCVDTTANNRHCGACGKPCAAGSFCFQGQCVLSCPDSAPLCGLDGQKTCCSGTCCGAVCVETKVDPQHCGTCGNACPRGQLCVQSHCTLTCPTDSSKCGTSEKTFCCQNTCCNQTLCIDLQNDRKHCGACNQACPEGHVCLRGQCQLSCPANSPACGVSGQEVCCPKSCCNQTCTDTQIDPNHCGACNQTCSSGQTCIQGKCQFLCPPAQRLCGSECVNIQVNPLHCGGCDKKCGTNERCDNSTCQLCPSTAPACGPIGQQNCCSLSCCNNACIDPTTNPNHCGGCNNACKNGEYCNNSQCKRCPPQLASCGKSCCDSASCCNNACVDILSDPQHCGACNLKCNSGQTCCAGTCVDIATNTANCGSCQNACGLGQSCSAGHCCSTGQQWCDQQCVDPSTDNNHCGRCGNACSNTTQCNAGTCACRTGTTLCGTECVDTQFDQRHCGTCTNPCQGGQLCDNGVCRCPIGTTVCNGLCTNTQTSPQHCGACAQSCSPTQTCNAGQCQ